MADELLRDDSSTPAPFVLGIPIRRETWTSWQLGELTELRARHGRTYALRELTRRAQVQAPDVAATWMPAQVITMSLLAGVNRFVISYYCEEQVAGALEDGLAWIDTGARPGSPVRASTGALVSLYQARTPLKPAAAASELINLRLMMENPALEGFRPLFDDAELASTAPYPALMKSLGSWFEGLPAVAGAGMTLLELLRAAMKAHPLDLQAQLAFILRRLSHLLPAWLLAELQLAGDILSEETAARGMGGPGQAHTLTFESGHYEEYENFSPDADWMSNVVLLAKSTYVWLDQLSKEYGREVRRLDQVPDEELDRLARWGVNGLWLIGVWERSRASRTVKQWRGNPEALASAYSLHDYVIADDLGGEAAWWSLRERARARGIRMSTDMVPNHTGIDSRWIVDHPDWFLQLDHPPYPGYRFSGADLSEDDRVSVHIEDGYWDHSDAAVVFKHFDHRDGRTRYIYHGNDGTSMPWNDTAQLDYLNAEAREAIIQTILHVARKSSIIRFDAAMTLAKKHIQRLWYPPPGHGGAIPSRAQYGTLSQADFDRAIPEEFWREVVDRVAAEVPDTLLLAEAFWLMEGYFVRTLGMHRVYNSAFMHMLRDEDNAEYRQTIKNVLGFSAEVLKRFVNFMNNPDEETAVEQFGKGDKYFGVCLLMVTLPGLPMIGHGQIQGFAEKYGMEYAKAYWDEHVDEALVARHQREIFPLLRKRYLFSQVDEFAFYDVEADGGWVDEDVYAYSNRAFGERGFVAYNNALKDASGWARVSVPTRRGGTDAEQVRPSLIEALGFDREAGLIGMYEHLSGLWYLRDSRELADRGLRLELGAYGAVAYTDFRVLPRDGLWGQLAWRLEGAGVADLDAARRHLELEPVRDAFWPLFDGAAFDAGAYATLSALAGVGADAPLADTLAALDEARLGSRDLRIARTVATCRALAPELPRQAGLPEMAADALEAPELAPMLHVFTGLEDGEPATLMIAARDALGVNRHDGKLWFDGGKMDALMAAWPAALTAITLAEAGEDAQPGAPDAIEAVAATVTDAEFRYDTLLEALGVAVEADDVDEVDDDEVDEVDDHAVEVDDEVEADDTAKEPQRR